MMRNKKNTIAKLLAEEDIFVVYKQMESAYFDIKNRELGLPIWKKNAMEELDKEYATITSSQKDLKINRMVLDTMQEHQLYGMALDVPIL